jgi:hypothetical protein
VTERTTVGKSSRLLAVSRSMVTITPRSMLDMGVPVVVHQCKTACGSVVVAASNLTVWE